MNKLHGIKATAMSVLAFLSLSVLVAGSAGAQEKPKPVAQTPNPAPQTEPMGCCGCCKKMAAQKPNDTHNKMPGMNHPAPLGK